MNDNRFPACRIHPTALIEDHVTIGDGSAVWDNAHIRHGANIGSSCIIGEKTYVAYDVRIGDFCKLNAGVYVCAGVTIADYVMLSAHTVFTNDRFPRAFDRDLNGLATSDPTPETLRTRVGRGVTTGANATIGPGLTIGAFAMVGMGAVVTHDVPPHALVIGNPARLAGWVCRCGHLLVRTHEAQQAPVGTCYECRRCARIYQKEGSGVREMDRVEIQREGRRED
ncbi:MAG TPA: DapH/DapD/GlmU-related protein [Bacteroidota bacterium]